MPKQIAEKADIVPQLAEVFRKFGYEGTSLARITHATGLGKGSLYHFFPGGKKEMASAVLSHVDTWFIKHIFTPLETTTDPDTALGKMYSDCLRYFNSGQRICLVGAFALDDTKDLFASQIQAYFTRWISALEQCLIAKGVPAATAQNHAAQIVASIQGAIVLARSTNNPDLFEQVLSNSQAWTKTALSTGTGWRP
ncbi:TetR/AcrR family transcriptional regulator [Cognatishimia sp. WU-CL00825]|uniref:TetR/AcrR family transcriptional regulator n=1 Tax=Cognatishimia sp. WU-CL00825 TaxID=3127658 RepID=UPI0031084D5F